MKINKAIAVLSLSAVLAVSVLPGLASANDGGKGFSMGGFFKGLFHRSEHKLSDTSFVLAGTVVSVGTNSLVVKVQTSANVPNIVNSQATITTDANTKITGKGEDKKTTLTLADVKVGDRVEANGNISGTTLTALTIRDLGAVPAQPLTTIGKVTAVSATSITLTNAIAGKSQVFILDSNSKVMIDGVTKAIADIQVGDAGTIKSKSSTTGFSAQQINLYR